MGRCTRKEDLGNFLSKGFTEVKEEDKRYFTKNGKLEKTSHSECFSCEMVIVNVFYSEMVNWEKQDMILKNHGHELNYGNLILQDRKYLGIIFISNILFPNV
jgi:hypothetical protein